MPARGRRALDGGDADAIVKAGTNLSIMRLAAAELRLGKPVTALALAAGMRSAPVASRTGCRAFGRLPGRSEPQPVEPKPPAPRLESIENSSTTAKSGRRMGTKTICAKRSPGAMVTGSLPGGLRFQALTRIGPV